MNPGIFGFSYGAPLDPYRRRVRYGQGANRFNFDVLVLGITDTTTPASKSTGGGSIGSNVTDMVLAVPYSVARRGQQVTAVGALSVQVPDGGITGGNRRGAGSVDFSTSRAGAGNVASGVRSFLGPAGGIASGASSTSLSGGAATNTSAVAIGSSANASGIGAVALGQSSTASGTRCVSAGWGVTASGVGSCVLGRDSTDRGIASTLGFGAAARVTAGDRNLLRRPLCCVTADATVTTLTSDAAAEATTNTWVIPADYTGIFSGYVVARATAVAGGVAKNDSKGWKFEGMVTRDTAASTVTLLGTATPVTVGTADASMAACALTVTVNTTNGSLIVQATGIAATSIAWHGWIDCAENG